MGFVAWICRDSTATLGGIDDWIQRRLEEAANNIVATLKSYTNLWHLLVSPDVS